jgi:AcrR family transcriptional regulator
MPKMILEYKKAVIKKIVDTAMDIFSTKGYQELTMDEIAKKLGISKGALYSYFTSKDEILKEIYKNGRGVIQKTLTEALDCTDFKEAMETIFQTMNTKYAKDIVIYFEILALAAHNENFKETLKTDYQEDLKVTEEFIQMLRAKDQISPNVDPTTSAQVFRSIWMGLSEKILLGYGTAELHKDWVKSTSAIFKSNVLS